jgi:ABC-type transporter Mla subunit MlaD
MTTEEMERAIEFLLERDARFSDAMDRVKEAIDRLTGIQGELAQSQSRTAGDLELLTGKVLDLTDASTASQARIDSLAEAVDATRSHLDAVIDEMRDSFNKLILANEVTRGLTEKVAALEVQTAQRVTRLESRVDDLESKP